MRTFAFGNFVFLSASSLICNVAAAQDIPVKNPAEKPDAAQSEQHKNGNAALNADVAIGFGFDDNIFATKNRKVGDTLVVVEPSVSYNIADAKNRFTVRASGDAAFYGKHSSENYDDWLVGADGRLGLAKQVQVIAGGTYQWEHESRTSPENEAGFEPTRYRRAYGYAGVMGQSGNVAFRLGATISTLDFSNTPSVNGIINNHDRDRSQVELGARVGYMLHRGPEIFVQGLWDRRDYRQKTDDWGYHRDSSGFSLAGGLRHKFAKGLSGEVFAGILQQDYADPLLKDVHTVDYGMLVDWSGQDNLSATFRLDRNVEETTLPGASAYVLTSGSLSVDALAAPRLAIGATLSGANYDYRGVPRSEFVLGANIWTRYWLNPHFFVGAGYTFAQRASNEAGFDFDQNRVMLRFGTQLQPRYASHGKLALLSSNANGLNGVYFAVLLGHGALVTGIDGPRSTGSNTADFGDVGFDVGAALGYGMTFRRLYLGVEVEGLGGGPDWRHDAQRTFSVARNGSFGASLRLGHLTSHDDLVYGRFGVVSTRFRTTYLMPHKSAENTNRRVGLGFGLGLEAAVGTHGFVRAEYNMISYPDYDVGPSSIGPDNVSNSEDQFRLGVGIRFGANPDPKGKAIDFSGFYAGVSLGHGALTSSNQGPRNFGELNVTRSGHGSLLGIFAGAGKVFHEFYVGGELNGDTGHLDWNTEREPEGRVYSVAHDYSYGASALLGHLLSSSALLYGRIGAVRTRFDTRYATPNVSVRKQVIETGLQYGMGLQVGLGRKSRLRLEYDFTEYPKYAVAYGHSSDDFRNYENGIRLGISWKI